MKAKFKIAIMLMAMLLLLATCTEYYDEMYIFFDQSADDSIGTSMYKFQDTEGFDIMRHWRDSVSGYVDVSIQAGSGIHCELFRFLYIKQTAHSSAFHINIEQGKGKLYDGDIFWLDIALDDGTDKDFMSLAVKSDKAPEKPGDYCVFLPVDNVYYSTRLRVI